MLSSSNGSQELWRLIWSISGLSWLNAPQKASGSSFSAFLGSARQVALRKHAEADAEADEAEADDLQ